MKFNDLTEGFYSPEDDELNKLSIKDTRKPRLTLKHLNNLRKMREAKKLEMDERKKFYSKMYRPEQEEGGDAAAGLGL